MNPWVFFGIGLILVLLGIFVPLPTYSPLVSTNMFLLVLGFFLWTPLLFMFRGTKQLIR